MSKLSAKNVSVTLGHGASAVAALRKLSIEFESGAQHLITGPSGSGKTTLLSILGGLLTPDSGGVEIDGTDIFALTAEERTAIRRSHIGYVFQSFRLMPALSAEENILLSLDVRRVGNARIRCHDALEVVGLSAKAGLTPDQMSGGEQQRTAIARAIAHRPTIVLADEPTANLDSANGCKIMEMLNRLARDPGRVVVVVSHDPRALQFSDRLVRLEDGCLVGDELCHRLQYE